MGLERLKALFRRRGSSDALTFSKSEVYDRGNGKVVRWQIISNSHQQPLSRLHQRSVRP